MAVDPYAVMAWLRRLTAFDSRVFEEVRSNPTATIPAVGVVLVSMLLAGLGGWLWWVLQGYSGRGDVFVESVVVGSLIAVALWGVIWVGIVYLLLTQFFRERVFLEQLLRVMGLAASPLGLMVFMAVPRISLGVGIAALALTFGLTNVAIQSVTRADPLRVLFANLAGFTVWAALLTVFVSEARIYAPGVFVFQWPAELSGDIFKLNRTLQGLIQN